MTRKILAALEGLITDQEGADLLGVSRTTFRRLRYGGAIPTVRVGSLARVRRSDLAAYIAAQTGGAA